MGIFCRLGSLLESRPVAVTVWLKEVWTLPVSGIDELGQGVHIGGFELGKAPVFQDLGRKREILGQFVEDIHIRGVSGLGAFAPGKFELLEEDFSQLLGGIDVEFLPGQFDRSPARSFEVAPQIPWT